MDFNTKQISSSKKKILYINKQYRDYDYLKYLTIAGEFQLTVIWICPFRKSEPLPASIGKKIKYFLLGFKGNRLKPYHIFFNIRLFELVLKYGKNADIIISSTSDAWHSKIAFLSNLFLKKEIAFRKQVWFNTWSSYLKKLYNLLTIFIEKHSAALFYPGQKQRNFFLSHSINQEKLHFFPRLIDDLQKRILDDNLISSLTESLKNKIVFLYMGRIISQKGLDILIDSFSRLEKVYKNVSLIIVGGPSRGGYHRENSIGYYQYCLEKASQKCRNVYFFGPAKHTLIHNYYYLADVFIHPHRRFIDNQKPVWEGWGNVVVEAASMSLPLIATDRVSSAYELIKVNENGIIVDSENLEENLFKAMKFFVENKNKIIEFGKKSREIFEKYNDPQKLVLSIYSAIKGKSG